MRFDLFTVIAKQSGIVVWKNSTTNLDVRNMNRITQTILTFMALMADLVMEIIFARDIGGLVSISENN